MEIREYYQSKLKKSFLLSISMFAICSIFVFNSQAIAQTPSPPDPPINLGATAASSTQINIGWTIPLNTIGLITGYKIEYKIGSGDYSVLVANTANTNTSYVHTGLTLGTTYTYRVSTISSTGTSIPSNEVSATTFSSPTPSPSTGPPDPPTNLLGDWGSSTQINISWTTPSNNGGFVTGYKIEYKIGSGDYSVLVANTANTNTSYVHTGLTPNTTYTYRVSTISSTGTSIPSNEVSVTTPSLSDPPNGLTATAVSTTQINLSWNPTSNNGGSAITRYVVEYKTPTSGGYSVLVANTPDSATSYSATGLDPNTTYTYRVSAINYVGSSIPSNEASAKTQAPPPPPTPAPPDQPTGLTATAVSPTQINLTWIAGYNGGSPITGYEIEYKIGSGDYSVLVANTANTNTSYVHTSLTPNTTYTYRVSIINTAVFQPSNEASATTLATVPNPPTGLTATAVSPTQINLAWTPPSNNGGSQITGYKIEYKIGRDSYSLLTHTANQLTYFNTGLTPSTSYTYRVSTDNAAGTSTSSNEASATTQALATNVSTTKITGTYSDPENGIQITFPDGWSGNMMHSVNVTAVMLTKNTEIIPSITFEIVDKSTLEKMVGALENLAKNLANNTAFMQTMMKSGKGCNVIAPTSITVNGMSGMQMKMQCTSSGQSFTYEMTMFETNKNFVSLLFMTTDFEKDGDDYNSALNSLKISNTVKVPFEDLTTVRPSTNTPTQSISTQPTTTQPTQSISTQPTTTQPTQNISTQPTQSISTQPTPTTLQQTPLPSTQQSSSVQSTTQTPLPSLLTSPHISFIVSTDKSSYSLGDTVTATVLFSGTNKEQNIAVSINDQTGSTIVSKTVTTNSVGAASLQFNLPTSAQSGSYQVVATSSYNNNDWGNSASFDLQQNGLSSSIGPTHTTAQQGNSPSSYTGLGFLNGMMKFFNGLFHW